MLPIDAKSMALLPSSPTALMGGALKDSSPKSDKVNDNYLDQNALNSVKAMGRKNDPQALKEIAKKFEGMFVQQMLKSMRDANEVFAEGNMLSSDEMKFHQEMLDQQMVINLTSGKGIGLATSMFQQMQKMHGKPSADSAELFPSIKNLPELHVKPSANAAMSLEPPALISRAAIKTVTTTSENTQTPEEFVASLMPFAEKTAKALNVNTDVILAQAALETGWGKHVIHDAEGNSSFNIFNIKKSAAWDGKTVGVSSLEFKQGVAKQEHSEFRQYDNVEQGFNDYIDLMKNSPRYQDALSAGANSKDYAQELQKAGYATDPEYAEKIKRILASDVIRNAVDGAQVDVEKVATNTPNVDRG